MFKIKLDAASRVRRNADYFGVQISAECEKELGTNIDVVLKALGFPLVGQRFPQAVEFRCNKVVVKK